MLTSQWYTQVTSRCRIQSFIFWFSSRKRTQRNDESFPSSMTQKWDRNETEYALPRASLTGLHTALSILDVERLDLQIDALSKRRLTPAETRISRLLGYRLPPVPQQESRQNRESKARCVWVFLLPLVGLYSCLRLRHSEMMPLRPTKITKRPIAHQVRLGCHPNASISSSVKLISICSSHSSSCMVHPRLPVPPSC